MSEGFSFPGHRDTAGDGEDAEGLHAVMALATADIDGVRVDPARLRRAQRRHRLSEGGVVAGVLSVAVVAATIAVQGGGGATKTPAVTGPAKTSLAAPTTAQPLKPIMPVAVSVYDFDDGSEGKGTVGRLLSGTGAWDTNQYCQKYPTLHNVPKNTGVIFDLGTSTRVAGSSVSVGTAGASLEMWAADSSVVAMPDVRPGQPPAGFTKVASVTDSGSTAALTPAQPVTTRFVLVWFTGALPVLPNPDPAIHCANSDGHLYGDSITVVRFTRG